MGFGILSLYPSFYITFLIRKILQPAAKASSYRLGCRYPASRDGKLATVFFSGFRHPGRNDGFYFVSRRLSLIRIYGADIVLYHPKKATTCCNYGNTRWNVWLPT